MGNISTNGTIKATDFEVYETSQGYWSFDSSMNLFPAIMHNGENLWIGAGKTAGYHHVGKTFLSAGYDSSSSKGNPTAYICVPNTDNTNGTNYGILHTGNFSSYALPLSGVP